MEFLKILFWDFLAQVLSSLTTWCSFNSPLHFFTPTQAATAPPHFPLHLRVLFPNLTMSLPHLKIFQWFVVIIWGKTPNPPICKASRLIFYAPPAPLVCTSATLTLSKVLPHHLILIWHFMFSWSTHLAGALIMSNYLSSSSIISLSLPFFENIINIYFYSTTCYLLHIVLSMLYLLIYKSSQL